MLISSAAETAERDKKDKEKADELKLAEDRYRQNAEALANIQKSIVCLPMPEAGGTR